MTIDIFSKSIKLIRTRLNGIHRDTRTHLSHDMHLVINGRTHDRSIFYNASREPDGMNRKL